ncbi:MAG: hypothetical protein DPW09_05080 [Anaerolineae bacterium]|nr:hypothetical protein [Anaerolineae bacterium]
MPNRRPKLADPHKEQLIRLVKTLLDRSGLTIETVLARMQTQGCDISRATFENCFTTRAELKPNVPPDYALTLIAVFIEGLPKPRQCAAAEALRLADLTRLPLSQLEPLRYFFDPAEFTAALQSYLPLPTGAPPPPHAAPREDWAEAPDVAVFYGRQAELVTLTHWAVEERCRLIGLMGLGGVGKSALCARLGRQIKGRFECAIWRSLREALPLDILLAEWLQFLLDSPEPPADRLERQIARLLDCLRQQRCLLVLDNVEAILPTGSQAGRYRPGYEGYGHLFRRIGESDHRSCLLLTSRETPSDLALLAGDFLPTRLLTLSGLDLAAGQSILQDKGISGQATDLAEVVRRYSGNPLALKLAAASIQEFYGGQANRFLDTGSALFSDTRHLLEQQFSRLSALEAEVMYWLAIEREPTSLVSLQADMLGSGSVRELAEALHSLQRRFLMEQVEAGFTLQNVIMEFVTDRLIHHLSQEMLAGRIELWQKCALVKVQGKEYVRQIQTRLLLAPIAERLLAALGRSGLEAHLRETLAALRRSQPPVPGYAAGNILNLLTYLDADLSDQDLSGLFIWQADLRQTALPGVNLAQADLSGSVFRQPFESVWALAFSPDGQHLVSGLENGEIRLWRLSDGQPWLSLLDHSGFVYAFALSPDGCWLASSGNDQIIRLWDTTTWHCRYWLRGHSSRCREVAFSPDGRLLASAGEDQTIRLWDISTGQSQGVLSGHTDQVWSVAFHPHSGLLVSSSLDQTVRLWDVNAGEAVAHWPVETTWLRCLAFSPDGRWLAGGAHDNSLYLWSWPDLSPPKILAGHTGYIRRLIFSPDGRWLVSAGEDKVICFWEVNSGRRRHILTGHAGRVYGLAFSPDGRQLASSGDDKTIHLWDGQTQQSLKTWQGYANRALGVAFSPDGQTLGSSYGDGRVQLWQAQPGRPLKTLAGHSDRVWGLAFSPAGRLLASGSYDKTIKIWDLTTYQCLHTLYGHTDWVRQLTFSPTGDVLISVSDDATIRFWRVESGECERVLHGHTSWIWTAALSPDGRLLATGSGDQTVRLWQVESGECVHIFSEHSGQVWAVAFSPDGRCLASAGQDATIRLWDLPSRTCSRTLAEGVGRVWGLCFSGDGQALVSVGEDYTGHVWDIATGRCRQNLAGHTDLVLAVALHPGGSMLATASLDITTRLWDIDSGHNLATLRPDRPYERMNITDVTGLTEVQKASLRALGAIEKDEGGRMKNRNSSHPMISYIL